MSNQKLANLALIINELRVIIGSSGQGVYSRDMSTAMRQTLSRLEKEFVADLLTNIDQPTLVDVNRKIAEAKLAIQGSAQTSYTHENIKTSIVDGSTIVTVDPVKKQEEKQEASPPAKIDVQDGSFVVAAPTSENEVDIGALLKEEKNKVAKRKK